MFGNCRCLGFAFVINVMLGCFLPSDLVAQSETSATVAPSVGQSETARLGLITRTTALIGAKVRDRGDSTVGIMDDIVVCLPTGQAAAALFSPSDTQAIPVPAQSFWTATGNKIMVNADRKKLKGAPCIPKTDLNRALDLSSLRPSFDYFGQELPNVPATGSGGLSSAAALIHRQLLSRSGQPLGEVEDLMVDLPAGQVVYLVIRPAGGADADAARYLVPPQAVRADTSSRGLKLQADQAHFLAGPRFQQEYRTDTSRAELRAAVLHHYKSAAAPSQADRARKPVRPRLESAPPTSQAASARSDRETTQAVVTEIVRNDNAFPTRDLKISTSNGRVTLRGRVKNGKQTQELAAAAARVVGPENVINQLQTR